jgi:hypothetical protein
MLKALTLERILVVAVVLILAGAVALLWGFGEWAERGFGPLNVQTTMRVMILALTALVAGLQLMLSGFLASMIDIPLEEGRIAVPADDFMLRRLDEPGKKR